MWTQVHTHPHTNVHTRTHTPYRHGKNGEIWSLLYSVNSLEEKKMCCKSCCRPHSNELTSCDSLWGQRETQIPLLTDEVFFFRHQRGSMLGWWNIFRSTFPACPSSLGWRKPWLFLFTISVCFLMISRKLVSSALRRLWKRGTVFSIHAWCIVWRQGHHMSLRNVESPSGLTQYQRASFYRSETSFCPSWWHMSVILVHRRLRMEDHEFKSSLSCTARPCLKKKGSCSFEEISTHCLLSLQQKPGLHGLHLTWVSAPWYSEPQVFSLTPLHTQNFLFVVAWEQFVSVCCGLRSEESWV